MDADAHAAVTTVRVLLVDDEPALLRSYARVLSENSFEVHTARDGSSACAELDEHDFDVIVSDVCMPKVDGVELLKEVRRRDLDVPVVLITASPSVDTAVQAVEFGALKYLYKPLAPAQLLAAVHEAARLNRLARLKRDALALLSISGRDLGDRASLELHFNEALEGLWIAYQPIVSWERRRVIAFEALLRTGDQGMLRGPGAVLDAAERLERIVDLGRVVRGRILDVLPQLPEELSVFVNLHPRELFDDQLIDPADPFARMATRFVLEVTERHSLEHLGNVAKRITALKRRGYRIAVDDLGAGYAGLSSFAQLTPSVTKLDMSLTRDIDQSTLKQRLVRSMVQLCAEMGTQVIVEGVETEAERETLVACGCDLMQGFLFGRPKRHPQQVPGFANES